MNEIKKLKTNIYNNQRFFRHTFTIVLNLNKSEIRGRFICDFLKVKLISKKTRPDLENFISV